MGQNANSQLQVISLVNLKDYAPDHIHEVKNGGNMMINPDAAKLKDTKWVITNNKGATVRLGPDGPGNPDFPGHVENVLTSGNVVVNLDGLRMKEAANGIASPITFTSGADGSVVTIEGLLI